MTVRQNNGNESPEQPNLLELAARLEEGAQVELTPEQRRQLDAFHAQLAETIAPAVAELARRISAALDSFVQYVRQAVLPMIDMVRLQFAAFLDDIQRQFGMLSPTTRAQLDAAVLQVWEADADLLRESEPDGTDRSLWAQWCHALVTLLLALYLTCMVSADQIWPDQEWIGKLENHVAFILALGGLAYGAGLRRK
jgi:hypothetical protein